IIMALTGKDTKFYVARTKESSNEDSLVRTNTFNGMPSSVTEFGQADAYDDFETAKGTAQWMNAAPPFIKQDYDYYVIQKDEDSFRLDENGEVVTEEVVPEEDAPVKEEPAE